MVPQLVRLILRRALDDSHRSTLRRDGFEWKSSRLLAVGDIPAAAEIGTGAITLDAPYIRTQINRMQNGLNDDPGLAIGRAKELRHLPARLHHLPALAKDRLADRLHQL